MPISDTAPWRRIATLLAASGLLAGCIVGGGVGSGGGGVGLGFSTIDYSGTSIGIGFGSNSGFSIGAQTTTGTLGLGPSYSEPSSRPIDIDDWPRRDGIAAFGDRFAGLNQTELAFAAAHFAGARAVLGGQSAVLRSIDPEFLVLDDRLMAGLGERTQVIQGDARAADFPGEAFVDAGWYYALPQEPGQVRYGPGDWSLMDLDSPGWRTFFGDRVQSMRSANGSDGLVLGEADLPALFAQPGWQPALPTADPAFAEAWNDRIARFIGHLQDRTTGDGPIVAEVGDWTSRATASDVFDSADGIWVAAFATDRSGRPLNEAAWRLQMDRILRASTRGQAVVLQSPAADPQTLMFVAGSYLLARGSASYLSVRGVDGALWPPVYAIPVPPQAEPLASSAAAYDSDGDGVHVRRFGNATVYVHPRSVGGGRGAVTLSLGGTYYMAVLEGSGRIRPDGTADASVSYRPVDSLTLAPASAVVVFERAPASGQSAEVHGPGREPI